LATGFLETCDDWASLVVWSTTCNSAAPVRATPGGVVSLLYRRRRVESRMKPPQMSVPVNTPPSRCTTCRFAGKISRLSEAAFQNAIADAGRCSRNAQCRSLNQRVARSVASAICHGSSAWGTGGPRSSGVRRLSRRAPSLRRIGRESAGRPCKCSRCDRSPRHPTSPPRASPSRLRRTRLNLSSGSVQPGTLTFSHDRLPPPRYGLSRSLAM